MMGQICSGFKFKLVCQPCLLEMNCFKLLADFGIGEFFFFCVMFV